MNARSALIVAALALVPARAAAQELLLAPGPGGVVPVPGQFTLLPADATVISTSPMFLGAAAGPGATVAAGTTFGGVAAGSAGGQLFVGFDYVRPFWSFRDFTRPVPAGYASAFPVLGNIGHTDDNFAFVPQLQYNYHVADLDFDVRAAGTFLSLTGRFQRDVAATGGTAGDLVAAYDLTLVSVIPVQVARRLPAGELFGDKHGEGKAGAVVDLSIGTRYVAVDQGYTSTLHAAGPAGVSVATRFTSQSFRGLGLTAALGWEVPAADDWAAFFGVRGSVLIGDNERSSTATVVAAGLPAFSDTISEARTMVVPVAEVQAGVAWGTDLGVRLAAGDPPPELTVRVAAVGQYWGGLGPLSAGSSQGFRTTDLFLCGVSVQVGLRH